MGRIAQIQAREILDSRGIPTIEADVYTEHGVMGRASVPSGISLGKYEAKEVRDQDMGRHFGKGVIKCINTINKIISEELQGIWVFEQNIIDASLIELDGTKDKSNLGANTTLAVSLAAAKAAANSANQSLYRYLGGVNGNTLPLPLINVFSGGIHANNGLDFQDFMIVPNGASSFSDAIKMGIEVFENARQIIEAEKINNSLSTQGSILPHLQTNEEAIDFLLKAIEKAGYKPGEDISIAIDAAANFFYRPEEKKYALRHQKSAFSQDEYLAYWQKLIDKYPIISVEDILSEDDWEYWVKATDSFGDKTQLVGDDLFVTNTERILYGLSLGAANSVVIKPNQIGTLTETINAIELAQHNSMNCIVSHRIGETEDSFIVDLAVGLNVGQIKLGAPSRGETNFKFNQLIRLEEQLGQGGRFWGTGR